jgi:hypothetical protein
MGITKANQNNKIDWTHFVLEERKTGNKEEQKQEAEGAQSRQKTK